jgi:hypothetical protein
MLEAMLTVTILGGLIGVLCSVFEVGAANFRLGMTRTELQGELRRIVVPLRKDLKNTSYLSLAALDLTAPDPESSPRHALCFNGVNGRLQTNDRGLPRWSCYVLYFASRDVPNGRMIRALLRDDNHGVADDHIAEPLANFQPGHLSTGSGQMIDGELRTLSQQVADFAVELQPLEQYVQLRLRVRGRGGRTLARRSSAETLEVRVSVRPENTWPRL